MIKFTTLTLVGLAIAPPAYATTLNCASPTTWIGDPGRDPVVQTTINLTGDSWTVTHYTAEGHSYNRGDQYDMKDFPRADNKREWYGTHRSRSNLFVDGVVWNERGRTWYEERIRDSNYHGNTTYGNITSYTVQDCGRATPLPRSSPDIASGPIPNREPRGPIVPPNAHGEGAPRDETVPLTVERGAAHIGVKLGTHAVTMTVDTGASVSTITPAIADQLIADGQAQYTGADEDHGG
jgi:hypothetical protein